MHHLNASLFWSSPSDISFLVASFSHNNSTQPLSLNTLSTQMECHAAPCLVNWNQLTGYLDNITLVLPALSFGRKQKSPNKISCELHSHSYIQSQRPKFYTLILSLRCMTQNITNSLILRFLIFQKVIETFTLLDYLIRIK